MKKFLKLVFLLAFLVYGSQTRLPIFVGQVYADWLCRGAAESGDDAQESASEPYVVVIDYTYIEFVYPLLDRSFGAQRFPNVTVSQGATINSAYIWLWRYDGRAYPYDSIACEDVDSAAVLVSENANISNRWSNRTTAVAVWEGVTMSKEDSTCDLKAPLQEIVNRPGWTSGNAVMFVYRNCYEMGVDSADYECFSWDYEFEGERAWCGSLRVNYTPAPVVSEKYLKIRK